MNRRVHQFMFVVPITIHVMSASNSAGDREELESFVRHVYIYDEDKVVENELGEKELSTRQLYLALDDITAIKTFYLVSCPDRPKKSRIIKRQEYRGRHNKTLIGVIYLS